MLLVVEDTDTSTVPTVATTTPGTTVTQTEITGTSTVPTAATASSVTVPEDTGTTTAGAVVTVTPGTTVTIAEDTGTSTAGILAITTIPVIAVSEVTGAVGIETAEPDTADEQIFVALWSVLYNLFCSS